MKRLFCDKCGNEISDANAFAEDGAGEISQVVRATAASGSEALLEVSLHVTNKWKGRDLCKYCAIDAINKLDDRPRAAST